MSPIMVNGRALGVARNGVFDAANTDPIPGGRLWPEAALTWNAMRAQFVADGGHPDVFAPGGPESSVRTLAGQRLVFATSPPGTAAVPGTSNHGWGLAVDIPDAGAQAWILRNGEGFGWSHDEGARVHERWHFRYLGAPRSVLRRLARDQLLGYTNAERRWIHEYDALLHADRGDARREVLRRVMTTQRKRVWRVAQPPSRGGDGRGWTRLRRRRYASLLSRTI